MMRAAPASAAGYRRKERHLVACSHRRFGLRERVIYSDSHCPPRCKLGCPDPTPRCEPRAERRDRRHTLRHFNAFGSLPERFAQAREIDEGDRGDVGVAHEQNVGQR